MKRLALLLAVALFAWDFAAQAQMPNSTGGLTVPVVTASTTSATGSLIVGGGAGIGGALNVGTTLGMLDTSAAFYLNIGATSSTALSANRILTLDMKNVAHTLAFNATANTITFPNTASYTLVGSGDTGTVTNTMLAGSITAAKLVGTDITTVGALAAGSIASGFGSILTLNTITASNFVPTANSAPTVGVALPAAARLGLYGTTSELFSGATDIFDWGVTTASVETHPQPITLSNAAVKMTAITTGTNADTVCLKADGTLLIQAAACTISKLDAKEDVKVFDGNALGELSGLVPITFRMKKGEVPNPDNNYTRPQIGLFAENVAAVDPRLAIYEQDGVTPKSYRQEAVIALLVAAVQEQQAKLNAIKKRLP